MYAEFPVENKKNKKGSAYCKSVEESFELLVGLSFGVYNRIMGCVRGVSNKKVNGVRLL